MWAQSSLSQEQIGSCHLIAGSPLVWKFWLISESCLPTSHAERAALPPVVGALPPMCSMAAEVLSSLKLPSFNATEMHGCFHEDNQGACLLASNPLSLQELHIGCMVMIMPGLSDFCNVDK